MIPFSEILYGVFLNISGGKPPDPHFLLAPLETFPPILHHSAVYGEGFEKTLGDC